jgi:hypothetical protein
VFRASQERVSLSWEAKALNGLELPVGDVLKSYPRVEVQVLLTSVSGVEKKL